MNTTTNEILFIDANVLDKKSLITGLSANIHVVALDDKTNVLNQIAAFLDGYQNLDAIHIVSHGAEGELVFANGVLNNANLNDYASQLQRIGSALSETGDLLLYGCNVAKGEDGLTFINTLADLIGADVAASDDLTGSALSGGDKQLEVNRGTIEAMPIDFNYTELLDNAVSSSTLLFSRHTMGESRNGKAFAAIKSDGSVVTWGNKDYGGDSSAVANKLDGTINVVQVFSNYEAFAALRADGSVVAWGGYNGEGSNSVSDRLDGNVDIIQVFSTDICFAALRADGSVVTWESSDSAKAAASKLDGTIDVVQVFSNLSDFAALRADGSVVTWGPWSNLNGGSDSSAVANEINGTIDVIEVFSSGFAFAALRADGSVVTWGYGPNGGDSSAVASKLDGTIDVVQVFSNYGAFAALRADGSVVTWGNLYERGSYTVANMIDGTIDIAKVFSTYTSFAALRVDGSVVTWGRSGDDGGDSSAVASKLDGTIDVVKVFSTGDAFAALRTDGSVVTWGGSGGNSSSVADKLDGTVDVVQIFSTDGAFAALRADGSVVTWGRSGDGGDSSAVASKLDGTIDVVKVFSTGYAFAALRTDGSVITWGDKDNGGDSSSVASKLTSGVLSLSSIEDNTNLVFNDSQSTTNVAPTGTVIISGTAKQGQTLTASNNLADTNGLGTIDYQWYRNGNALSGKTQSTYVLTQSDVGKNISVTAGYTDGQGKLESVSSSATALITSSNNAPAGYASAALIPAQVNKSYMVYASDLLKGFNDADGDTLNIINLSTNTGSLINNNNGSWTFTPQTNYTGSATFSYTVTDNKGGNIAATQSLNINAASLPIISVGAKAISEGNSGEQILEVDVSLNKASITDVTVSYTVETGTGYRDETTDWATPNVDFKGPSSGTMTILAGQTHGYILFSILGDNTAEKNEILGIINLANPKNADLATIHAASITIINDDVAPQNHSPLGNASAILSSTAKDTPYSIISSLLLQGFSDADGDSLSVRNLSATHGNITNNNNGTWTFIPENNYSGVVNLSYTVEDSRNGSINATQSFSIQSNPKLSVNSPSVNEGDAGQINLTFNLTLSQSLSQNGSVDYNVQSGTATAGTDFTTASGTIQFNAGETSKTITVPVLGDNTIENDETFNLVLSNPRNIEFGNSSSTLTAIGTILNDDFPILTIANSPSIQEGNSGQSNLNFTVRLSEPPLSAISVDYATKGLTASTGQDFTAQSGTLKFNAGEKEKTISIPVLGDTNEEPDETVSLVLSNPQNGKFANSATQLSATGTILNDDSQSIRLSSPSIQESDSGTRALRFAVSLGLPVLNDTSFDYKTEDGTATTDVDYVTQTGTVKIPAGSQTVEIPISILGDTRIEPNETIKLTLSNAQGINLPNGSLPISSLGTILDDDFPIVSIADAKTVYQSKIGLTRSAITFSLNSPALVDGTISYHTENGTALQGNDFIDTNTSGKIVIPANADSGVITIGILASDATDTPNETFKVVIDKVEGGIKLPVNQSSLNSVITIADLMLPLLSIKNSEISEGNTGNKTLSFKVNLSTPATQDVTFSVKTIDKTATVDQDYKGVSLSMTIPKGGQSIDIPVAILGDATSEADETFTLELSKVANAIFDNGDITLTATGKILDDDKPFIRIEDKHVTEGNSGLHDEQIKVTLSTIAATPVTVHYVSIDGVANAGEDFIKAEGDLIIPVGAKEANIPVSIQGDNKPESAQDFHILLTNPVNGQFLNSALSIQNTVTIDTDDSDSLPQLSVIQKPVYEGDTGTTDYPVTLKLSTPATSNITLDYQTLVGDAKAGSDFIAVNGIVTFLAGESTSQVTIKVYGDTEVESDENFTLQFSNPQGIRLINDLPTQDIPLLIQDDDAEPAQTLQGTPKNDVLDGGTGDDILDGLKGIDTMIGGDGNDIYYVDNIKDSIAEEDQSQSNAGDDDLVHSIAASYILPANVEHLIIDGKLKGNGTGNVLDNKLSGNLAVNVLSGLGGNDTLDGGSGNDTLTGGDGNDTFVFSQGIKGNKNIDTVKDFVHGQDKIYLSADIFSKLADAVGFVTGSEPMSLAKADSHYLVSAVKVKAVDVNSYLLYDTKTGVLAYDEDGNGKVAASTFMTLTGKPTFTLDDFWIS